MGLKTGAYIFRCDNNAAKKNPTHPSLRFHGVLGRHKFLESLIFRIYRQKLPTNKAYIKPSAKLLGDSKNMLIFDVAQPESTEVYRITKTDFIRFQFRHDVKNRLWWPYRKEMLFSLGFKINPELIGSSFVHIKAFGRRVRRDPFWVILV